MKSWTKDKQIVESLVNCIMMVFMCMVYMKPLNEVQSGIINPIYGMIIFLILTVVFGVLLNLIKFLIDSIYN